MDFLNFLNSDLIFPFLALVVLVAYVVNRIRANRKFKR